MDEENTVETEDDFFTLEEAQSKPHFLEGSGIKKAILLTTGGIVSITLIGVLIMTIHAVVTNITWIKDEYTPFKFPLHGEHLSIKKVETYWQSSNIEVKKNALPELKHVPAAKITIHKKSGAGKVRCFFTDGNGKYVGDPITKSFSNGSFEGEKELLYLSTDGMETSSDFNAYYSGYSKPWHLLILEGDEDSNTLSQFKEIARIKVFSNVTHSKSK